MEKTTVTANDIKRTFAKEMSVDFFRDIREMNSHAVQQVGEIRYSVVRPDFGLGNAEDKFTIASFDAIVYGTFKVTYVGFTRWSPLQVTRRVDNITYEQNGNVWNKTVARMVHPGKFSFEDGKRLAEKNLLNRSANRSFVLVHEDMIEPEFNQDFRNQATAMQVMQFSFQREIYKLLFNEVCEGNICHEWGTALRLVPFYSDRKFMNEVRDQIFLQVQTTREELKLRRVQKRSGQNK
jgi:hypothetical protein